MSWFDILWWLFIGAILVVVGDFIRLVVLRWVWNRRHARMVDEVRRRYADGYDNR
jgi:hypothetical protein